MMDAQILINKKTIIVLPKILQCSGNKPKNLFVNTLKDKKNNMVTNFLMVNNIKFFIHWETEQRLNFRAICSFPTKHKNNRICN